MLLYFFPNIVTKQEMLGSQLAVVLNKLIYLLKNYQLNSTVMFNIRSIPILAIF